jgi:hypothetical protein
MTYFPYHLSSFLFSFPQFVCAEKIEINFSLLTQEGLPRMRELPSLPHLRNILRDRVLRFAATDGTQLSRL